MNIPDIILDKFNIEKEVITDVSVRSNSNSNSGVSDLHRISLSKKRRKDINNINKGDKVMITKEGAFADLEKIDVNGVTGKVLVQIAKVLITILITMRSNQLLTEADKLRIKEEKAARDVAKADTSKAAKV